MGIARGTADVAAILGQRYTVAEMATSALATWAAAERAAAGEQLSAACGHAAWLQGQLAAAVGRGTVLAGE
jgi:hypothetical protein